MSSADIHFVLRSLHLDKSIARPLFRQLYDGLRKAIVSGAIAPGSHLPPSRTLSKQLNIGRNTVLSAYEMLCAEGLCESRVGSGTRVTSRIAFPARQDDSDASKRPVKRNSPSFRISNRMRVSRTDYFNPPDSAELAFRCFEPDMRLFPRTEWGYALSRASRNAKQTDLATEEYQGYAPLREAICRHVNHTRGIKCAPDQIFITNGTTTAYNIIAMLFADTGDVAIVDNPGYMVARESLKLYGLETVAVDFYDPAIDFQKLADLSPKLIHTTPSAQFPLGGQMPLATRIELLNAAHNTDAVLVEDDYGGEYEYSGEAAESLFSLDNGQLVFYVNTFSLTMFPTIRTAYFIAPHSAVEHVRRVLYPLNSAANWLNQIAMADFMKSGLYTDHVRRMRFEYASRRRRLTSLAQDVLPEWTQTVSPGAGLQYTIRFLADVDDRRIATLAGEHGIAVRPLSEFYADKKGDSGLVLGFGAPNEAEIESGLKKLARVLNEASPPRPPAIGKNRSSARRQPPVVEAARWSD